MSFYLRVFWIIICMYVCNTVKMQMKKIKIKNLLRLSFHMLCSQNFFYWIVFSLWLVLLVWLSNFMSEQLGVSNWRLFLQPPLNGKQTYDFFATFCFIVVFVSLHQRQLQWRQLTFLKGEGLLFSFILIILFYHYFPF